MYVISQNQNGPSPSQQPWNETILLLLALFLMIVSAKLDGADFDLSGKILLYSTILKVIGKD